MEICGLNVPLWLVLIVIVFVAYYKYMTATFKTFKNIPGLRGPKPAIIVGTMGDLNKKGIIAYNKDLLEKYGKVVPHFQGRKPCLLVADLDMLKEIMIKQHSSFNQRTSFDFPPPLNEMLSVLKGDHWKHVRNLVSPTFSTGKLRRMVSPMSQCCETLVKNLEEKAKAGEAIDIRHFTGAFTMDVIASTAFGMDIDSQSDPDNPFVTHAKTALVDNLNKPIFIFLGLFPFFSKLFSKIGISYMPKPSIEFFTRIIEEAINRRSSEDEKRADFLQLMINAHEDSEYKETTEGKENKQQLTHTEVVAQGFTFFLAGFDNIANALSLLLFCLATNPEAQGKVNGEIEDCLKGNEEISYESVSKMAYLDKVVSESLRLYTPTARVERISQHDITINGVFIPKGVIINVPIDYLHHDPDVYPDPFKFDPERFSEKAKAERHPMSYQPFGVGPRQCIAMRLALLEVKMAAVALLQKFHVKPCAETSVPPKRNLIHGRPIDMILKFEKKQ